MKLSGVMLGSDRPKVLGAFYTKLLGKPGWEDGDWFGFEAGGGLMIGPHSEVKGKNDMAARIIMSFKTDDVKKEFERLVGLDASVVAEPYQPSDDNQGVWLATVADPDGNYLQLSTPWHT